MANTVISLFSGAMGLDLGLEQAGFEVRVAIEPNQAAAATISLNRPGLPVITKRIEKTPSHEILERARLLVGEATVVTGGPSCQTFSTAGSRRSLDDPRGGLFMEFIRVISDTRPRLFIMENVKGILSSAIIHRPLEQRGPGFPPLRPEEELGSVFRLILRKLKSTGYYVVFGVLNTANYGVPQRRERVIVIGARDGEPIGLPLPTHSENGSGGLGAWVTLREALHGLDDPQPEHPAFSENEASYLDLIPAGGNWRSLPEDQREAAIGGAYRSWGGRTGFLRRLAWDAPTPALTTNPDGKATMLCHPQETRPLSVKEYARLQQFPDSWRFSGSTSQKYTQIGNAVPIGLGAAIGRALLNAMQGRRSIERLGVVECPDPQLITAISKRPKTILNPPDMRQDQSREALDQWLGDIDRSRVDIFELVEELRSTEEFPDTARLNGYLPLNISQARWRAHKLTLELHRLYGSPNLGNFSDPIDETLYIILSFMTTEPSCQRVYSRLKESIGSWEELLDMGEAHLAELIKDAGLSNQKATNIIEALQKIRQDFGSLSLDSLASWSTAEAEKYLCSLPGIGTKGAKCILMYAFDRDVLPIDTHVDRVAHRLGLLHPDVPSAKKHLALEAVVPPTDRYSFHVNAVLHGRTVCHALRPQCGACGLRKNCSYYSKVAAFNEEKAS